MFFSDRGPDLRVVLSRVKEEMFADGVTRENRQGLYRVRRCDPSGNLCYVVKSFQR